MTDTGNETPHTIQFTNTETGFVVDSNIVVTGNVTAGYLYGDASNVTGIASNLHQIVENGNVTSNTVQFSNAITGLVTTANVEVGGELTVSGNVEVGTANLFVDTVNSRVGIGTTSPQYKLDVGNGGGDVMLRVMDQTASSGKLIFGRSGNTEIRSHAIESYNSSGSQNNYMKFLVHDGTGTSPYETRTEVMTLLGNGNVGIGTTSPTYKLNILTDTNYDGISLRDSTRELMKIAKGTNGAYINMFESGVSKVNIATGGDSYFVGGNVGIGTTSPGALLHVNGDIAVGANGSLRRTADNDLINIYAGSDNTSPYMFMTGKSRSSNANKIGFRIASATKFELYSDKAYFADNVGIGTTDPKTRLHVNHDLHLQSSSEAWNTTAGKGLYLRYSTTGGQNAAYIQSIDRSNTSLSYPMIFQGSTYQFSVGNVGIGTTSPLGRLHVQTETRSGTDGSGNGIYVTSGCAEYSNGSEFRHSNQSQGVGIGYAGIYATGYNTNQDLSIVSRGTGNTYVKNYAVFSDDRIKTNEEYIMNATETLMKLKPQVYDKHEEINVLSDNPKREAGLIAQDIYYDTPELRYIVSTRNRGIDAEPVNIPSEKPFVDDDPQKDPDYSGWGTASAGVAYIQLVPYLIRSNQEIYTELQAEKARNDSLEARILALENAS